MFVKTTTAIHGIEQAETPEGLELFYVYPGALTAKLAEGVTMSADNSVQEVELGLLLQGQDPLADESWRWGDERKPATRRWAQHVLAASVHGRNIVYEHDDEVVLVWAFIPARADELVLLSTGFTPAMASWRAPANPVTRALAAEMAACRSGSPVSALGEASAPDPVIADNEDRMDWPEHTWMRWAALTHRSLSFGNSKFTLRKQLQYGDDLVLRYAGRNCEFDLTFNMAQHPLVYTVTIRGKLGQEPFERVVPSVAWEDFEALFVEIGRLATGKPVAKSAEETRLEDARSALKALGLPPKKYAYYARRADEAIGEGKSWASVVARARRVADKLSGVRNQARTAPKPPTERLAARVPAMDVTLDSFNAHPGWRVQRVRSRANGYVLAVFPEGRGMDAAVASVDVVDGDIDEVRWLDERLTQSARDVITDRLDRALWDAYGDDDAAEDDDTQPRPSPLQDLIELMDRRSLALGARAANTPDLDRKDGYADIARALQDLARPTGPTAEELQRWLEAAKLMSAGEVVGRARGAETASVRQIMQDLWIAVFGDLSREQVAGRPGALRLPAETIFHDDDAGDFVLQCVKQGERKVLRHVRVRVGELDEDTDEVQVEDPSDRLASGSEVHRADRPEQFFIELYDKLGAFHDDLERAPRTLQDVRTLLYWAAVMLDAPLCQGVVKARAAAAFAQAKAFYDTARRALIDGRSVDAVRRMHEALARISAAAAEIARSCGEGQVDIAVTTSDLPVLPADRAAVDGLSGKPGLAIRRSDDPMRPADAPATLRASRSESASIRVTMSGATPTQEQLRERFSQAAQDHSRPTMPTYYIFRTRSGEPELLTRADIEARARAAVGDAIYDEAERNPMPGSDLFASAVGAVELAMDAEFEGRADPRWAASILARQPPREPEYYVFRTKSGLPELLTQNDIEAKARAIVGDDAYREIEGNPMPAASRFEAAVNIVEQSLQAEFEGRADPQWASSIQWGRQQSASHGEGA